MSLVVLPVRSRRDLRRFVSLPFDIHGGNPCWVPPLRSDEMRTLSPRNPAREFCDARYWIAVRGGRVVGRIAGIVNSRYVEIWNRTDARFGWVDFVDDPEVSQALFSAAEAWARERGMTALHGPLGFTDLDPEGMLLEGYDELATMATLYNPPYYPRHLERLGFTKEADWVEYQITVPPEVPERMARLCRRVEQRLHLRTVKFRTRRELRPYAPAVFDLLNEAYTGLHGFVPLSEAQVKDTIRRYFSYLQPEYVYAILDADDRLGAFGITMPSLSRALQRARGRLLPFGWYHLLKALRREKTLDLLLVAVRSDLRGQGVNALLIEKCLEVCLAHGIRFAESNPELETNERVQSQWKAFPTRQHKRRRCYIKALAPAPMPLLPAPFPPAGGHAPVLQSLPL